VVLSALLNLAALLTWAERKQVLSCRTVLDQIAPMWGTLRFMVAAHHIDGIKMIAKDLFLRSASYPHAGACAALFPALVVFAVIPFGDVLVIGEKTIPLQVANLNVGILYIFSIASLAVYGTMLAGWASNNNYSLLGGLRASSQMISYEVSMGLSVLGLLMIYQSAQLDAIVREQGQLLLGFIPMWGVLLQPVAFFLFLAAAVAENKRAPFDLPEGESEISAISSSTVV
jgi:NADH-quinone oxidoreductase subunit H